MEEMTAYSKEIPFERIFVAIITMLSGLVLAYLAVVGPLFLGVVKYRTAEVINNQLMGQDLVNLFLLSPGLIIGGLGLLFKKSFAKYILMATPLFLIYYSLSYTIGWEWSSSRYIGNNEKFTPYFLFILVGAVLILFYSLSILPRGSFPRLKSKGLVIYSVVFSLFLSIFAAMWLKEVIEVIVKGTTRGYELAPTAFWLVRVFDLGFTIPLGFLSLYLLWTRPQRAFPLLCLFYGFFLTQAMAVNAMGWVMLFKKDPTFLARDLIVFSFLAVIIIFGIFFLWRRFQPVQNSLSSVCYPE